MATWEDDSVRQELADLADCMIAISSALQQLIDEAEEGTDVALLINSKDWLDARAAVFRPPGEPSTGYPTGGADIINLEAWRGFRG